MKPTQVVKRISKKVKTIEKKKLNKICLLDKKHELTDSAKKKKNKINWQISEITNATSNGNNGVAPAGGGGKKRKVNDLNDSRISMVATPGRKKKKVRFSDIHNDEEERENLFGEEAGEIEDGNEVEEEEVNNNETKMEEDSVEREENNNEPDEQQADKSMKNDRQKKKEIKKERKKKDNKNYDVGMKLKLLWEEMRREDCEQERRNELIKQALKLMGDNVKTYVNAHDTVRVIETIVQLGNELHRNFLFEQLKNNMLEFSKSKYSKFFVLKMLQHATAEQKKKIIESFFGHVKKLMRHSDAAQVMEEIYRNANPKEKNKLVQEYYGSEFYALLKDDKTSKLSQVLEKVTPIQRESILAQMKEELVVLMDKSVIRHSMVHFLLRQFFREAKETDKHEMAQLLKEKVVEILHTKDGARVGMECIWNGNAKDRKIILKSFKGFVVKIAKEEHGHMVLLAAFDSVDDTVLVDKTIIHELVNSQQVMDILASSYGLKVLDYLLAPRDTKFFHPECIKTLQLGDANTFSKKERQTRENELRETAAPSLLKLVQEKAKELIAQTNSIFLINILTMTSCKADKTPALMAVVNVFASDGPYFEAKGDHQMHIIERANTSFLIKKLIHFDKLRKAKEEKIEGATFSELLVKNIPKETLISWIQCNRGAFVLIDLIETNINEVVVTVKNILKNAAPKIIKKKPSKGGSILLDKLNSS